MSDYPLVSIITPCYNGEDFLNRYFKSILSQTYPNIELIFVNDGSTDRTEEIALSYKAKIEGKGYSYSYIYQNNAGQAAAINRGLKVFKGDYLTWPDSDDWMSPDCIEKKVKYLETHPQMGWVQCQTVAVYEENLNQSVAVYKRKKTDNGWLFDDLVFERDIYFAPGGYMVRSDAMLLAIPSRHIYESKTGQNWQLMLPVSYYYECGFLDEVLYYYVIRQNSHSRAEKDYKTKLEKTFQHQDTLNHVIDGINMPEKKKAEYHKRIEVKYYRKRLNLALLYHDRSEAKINYKLIRESGRMDMCDRILYIRCMFPPLDWGIKVVLYGKIVIRHTIRSLKYDL